MVASVTTIERVLDILERRLEPDMLLAVARDLLEVPGNKSFRDTVEQLHRRARSRRASAYISTTMGPPIG